MLATFDASGAQRVALCGADGTPLLTTANPGVVQGPAAHDAAASGNPLRVAGVYRGAPPAVADGDVVDLLVDAAGRPLVDVQRIGGLAAPAPRTPADGAALVAALPVEAVLLGYNGSTLERRRNNHEVTVLASAARTATTDSPQQTNYNAKGAALWLRVTVAAGGGETLNLICFQVDPVGGANTELFRHNGITAAGTYAYQIYPSIADTQTKLYAFSALALPRRWFVRVEHSAGGSWTYSVAASYIN